jgi:hypothetical protein
MWTATTPCVIVRWMKRATMSLWVVLGACAQRQVESGSERLARGDAAGARASYEAAVASECSDGKTTAICCGALQGKGDALLAAGERDAARATYEQAITRCPRWPRPRRQLFLARHPEAAEAIPAGEAVDVEIGTLIRPRLEPDLLLVWHGATLDGLPLPLVSKTQALAARRVHEIEAEAHVRPFADPQGPLTIVRTRHALVIPDGLRDQGPLTTRCGSGTDGELGRPQRLLPGSATTLVMTVTCAMHQTFSPSPRTRRSHGRRQAPLAEVPGSSGDESPAPAGFVAWG